MCALVGAALLAGCASAPQAPAPEWSGRLSLVVAADAGQPEQALTASFELRGNAGQGSLDLSGPLGTTVARAEWARGRYQLLDGRQVRSFESMEQLTEAGMGEPLPLQALYHWLRGQPWPAAASTARADGSPGFEQLGWQIDTQDHATGLLRAHRSRPPAVTLRIRLDTPGPR